jgi:hypothetical protein
MTRLWLLCVSAALACACGGAATDASGGGQDGSPAASSAAAATNDPPAPSSEAPADESADRGMAGVRKLSGPTRKNEMVELTITEAGFGPTAVTPAGRKYYTVGVRGRSVSAAAGLLGGSKGDDFMLDVHRFVYAQNDLGCLSRPEPGVPGVSNVVGNTITFPPNGYADGRFVFLVPDDTQRVRVLIAPSGEGRLTIPVGDDFDPGWPAPLHTIEDGSTMRVLVLPSPSLPASLPPAAAGRQHVLLDVVVENLKDQGIEFMAAQQFRMIDPAGKFIARSDLTSTLGCRVDDGEVIPPRHVRRMMAVYDLPAGAPHKLQYRGFEKDEAVVVIK